MDRRRSTGPLHPTHNALADTPSISAHSLEVEPLAGVSDEQLDLVFAYFGEDVNPTRATVTGCVHRRFTPSGKQGLDRVVDEGVADTDHLDRRAIGRLDLAGHLVESAPDAAPRPVDAIGIEPIAKLSLLLPSQRRHLLRICHSLVEAVLDQRERLQHRIVEVCCNVGSFVSANAGLPFGIEVGDQPPPPRRRHNEQADHYHSGNNRRRNFRPDVRRLHESEDADRGDDGTSDLREVQARLGPPKGDEYTGPDDSERPDHALRKTTKPLNEERDPSCDQCQPREPVAKRSALRRWLSDRIVALVGSKGDGPEQDEIEQRAPTTEGEQPNEGQTNPHRINADLGRNTGRDAAEQSLVASRFGYLPIRHGRPVSHDGGSMPSGSNPEATLSTTRWTWLTVPMGELHDPEEGGGMNATTDHEPAPPDPTPPDDPRPQQPAPPVRWLRRDAESPLAGVATGIANYFGINPIIVQVTFVVTTAFSGFGVLAYIACWLLIPRLSDPETRPVTITSNTARAVVGVLFAIGAASSTLTLGPNTFEVTLLPLVLVAGGFYLLNQRDGVATPTDPTHLSPASSPASAAHWADVQATPPPPVPAEPPGPPVTSVTLAVAAVVIGLLITINQFGAAIPAAAVIGAALAVVGGGLVYGAFHGRPRGLVPVAILLLMSMGLAPAVDAFADGGTGNREYAPVNQADVQDVYDLGAGPLELDLRRVDFTEDQTINVNVGAGYAEIWLPSDVNVVVEAESSAGYIEIFGQENAGLFSSGSATRAATVANQPTVTLDVEVSFGYVEVRRG